MKSSGNPGQKKHKYHVDDLTKRSKTSQNGKGKGPRAKDIKGAFGQGGTIGPNSKKKERKEDPKLTVDQFSNTMYLYYETKPASDE